MSLVNWHSTPCVLEWTTTSARYVKRNEESSTNVHWVRNYVEIKLFAGSVPQNGPSPVTKPEPAVPMLWAFAPGLLLGNQALHELGPFLLVGLYALA